MIASKQIGSHSAVIKGPLFLISALLMALLLVAAQASDFDVYPDDVATLLNEYQHDSDSQGSTIPSVLALQGKN